MESRKKASEQGWFYHAPPKAKVAEPQEVVGVPPASQIPGLSNLPPQVDQELQSIRGTIKDTDSPYVVMAKTGGRKDLLVFKDRKPPAKEAQGYPRVDWFYLEDNRLEDQAQREQPAGAYQPSLPEYMVHEHLMNDPENPNLIGGNPIKSRRAPYSFGNDTVYDREGGNANNKWLPIDEAKMPGYGVRQEKMKGKNVKYNVVKPPRGKAPNQELTGNQDYQPGPQMDESEKPVMGKIMSMGYVQDWQDQRLQWDKAQAKRTAKTDVPIPQVATEGTEYQDGFLQKQESANRAPKAGRRATPTGPGETTTVNRKKIQEESKPDFFKMKKFQNIPAKTDTHRIFNKMAAAT